MSDYLALEAVRLEDRLRVRFAVDPAAGKIRIPPMLLQTLVENAIKHGIATLPNGGDLSVRAAVDADSLRLEVENTGCLSEPKPGTTQVGLGNTRERLRILYGGRAHSRSTQRRRPRDGHRRHSPNAMKALIVDDERLARLELRRLLVEHPEIEIAGEARNGEEALSMIPQLAPDLLFLDIQMPGMTGFELLEHLEELPQVIFTTAYNEYAIKAFEVNALDYLLKPIVPARLAAAL